MPLGQPPCSWRPHHLSAYRAKASRREADLLATTLPSSPAAGARLSASTPLCEPTALYGLRRMRQRHAMARIAIAPIQAEDRPPALCVG